MSYGQLTQRQIDELKDLSNENELARAVFQLISERKRTFEDMDIGRLRWKMLRDNVGPKVSKQQFLEFFKLLEKKKYGSVIYGKDINCHTFKWNYSLQEVGKKALGITDDHRFNSPSLNTTASKSIWLAKSILEIAEDTELPDKTKVMAIKAIAKANIT